MGQHQPYNGIDTTCQPLNMPYRLISLYVIPHSPPIPGRDETISLLRKFKTGYGAHLASYRGPFSGESGRDWTATNYWRVAGTGLRLITGEWLGLDCD